MENSSQNPKDNSRIQKIIDSMKETNFIKRGDFTLKSGIHSNYYVDVKSLISYPHIMANLCNLIYIKIIDVIKKEQLKLTDIVLCGLPYAGIPFASYISFMHKIPMILLRKEKKTYGTKKVFEGSLEQKKHLILIDDILTTGISILESLEDFREYNINTSAVVLIDREENGGKGAVYKRLKNIEAVFTLNKFL